LRSSEEIALCVQGLCRGAESLEDSKDKLRGVVLSAHEAIAARSAEAKGLFGRVQSFQSSGGVTFLYVQARTQVEELAEERRQRSKPLDIRENSSKSGKKAPKLGRSSSCRRIKPRRSGPLKVFASRRQYRKSAQERWSEPSDLERTTVSR
jgi:hypothetical protein